MLVNIAVLNQITGKKNSSSVTEQKKSGILGEKRKQMAVLNLVERGSFSNIAKSFLFPFLTTSKGTRFSPKLSDFKLRRIYYSHKGKVIWIFALVSLSSC